MSNLIAACDINKLFPCVLHILNCYHMYSVLNVSLAGFLSLKICPAVRRKHPSLRLLGALSSAWGGGGVGYICFGQLKGLPTTCSLCHSKEENACAVRRSRNLSHGQRWATSRAVIGETERKSRSVPNEVKQCLSGLRIIFSSSSQLL